MNNGHKEASHSIEKQGDREVGIFDEAKERISDLTDEAQARGEKLIGQVKNRGSVLWDNAQDQGKDVWKGIQSRIQKNPGKTVGLALFVGAIIGRALMGTRNND
jgi:ElaB/YqjD/DUF883 family membrane-anchored ribosome-binding protein